MGIDLTNVEMTEWSCKYNADCQGYRTDTCNLFRSCEIAKYGKKLEALPDTHRCCKQEGCPPTIHAGSTTQGGSPPHYGSTLNSDPTKYPFVAPKPEELQGYIDAAIISTPVDPQEIVLYDGVPFAIEDLPSAGLRAMHGYGHTNPFDRDVVTRTDGKSWPYTPNTCLLADNPKGVWVDPEHLACPGCGRDGT